MIYRIKRTTFDIEQLKKERINKSGSADDDYLGKVVKKPWGYEYLMFENKSSAVWVLHINQGFSTSLHCHPKKKTSLLVVSGSVETKSLGVSYKLEQMDGILIDAGVFHSTQAVSEGDAMVIEIETPPDKHDLVRMSDLYGREHKAYEGASAFAHDIENYDFCFFDHNFSFDKKFLRGRNLGVAHHPHSAHFYEYLKEHHKGLLVILEGTLKAGVTEKVLSTGDVVTIEHIKSYADRGTLLPEPLVSLIII